MEYPWRERNRHACAHTTSAHTRCNESVPHNRRDFAGRSDANSHQGRGRDRDGLRPRSLNEKNLSVGPGGQTQHAMVDPKIVGWTRPTGPGTDALPNCCIRLRHKGKYSALASAE